MKAYQVGIQVRETRTTQSGRQYTHVSMKYGKQFATPEEALKVALPFIAQCPKQLFMLWEEDVKEPSK